MEKDKKACQFMCASRVPKGGREKKKKKRIALTQLRTPCRALANRRSIVIPYPCCQQATLRAARRFRCATPPQVEAATSQILFIALTNLNQFDSLGMPQTHPPQLAFLYLPMNKLRPHFLSW